MLGFVFTYISTLHYIMEVCAEHHIELLVLDRPNPNAHYIDGPVLKPVFKSFVGMHQIPVVYGMTIGELAKMIKGERWIKFSDSLDMQIIPCQNYTHQTKVKLSIKPSPNLPNERAILLYPSLCLLKGQRLVWDVVQMRHSRFMVIQILNCLTQHLHQSTGQEH